MYANKRAQFWIIAIILAYLAILTVFFYVRSADRSGVSLFEPTSDLAMQNIINAITIRNLWLNSTANDWYNISWTHRRLIMSTSGFSPDAAEIPTGIEAGKSSNCVNDLRATYLNRTEIPTNVSATTPPGCNLTFVYPTPFMFYVYYGFGSATTPAYRSGTAQQGQELTATTTFGSEMDIPTTGICSHLQSLYPRVGMPLNCTIRTTCRDPNRANFSLHINAVDFKYNGTIGPPDC